MWDKTTEHFWNIPSVKQRDTEDISVVLNVNWEN